MRHPLKTVVVTFAAMAGLALCGGPSRGETLQYVDQGPNWTAATRGQYYTLDQGSEMIPLAWLKALTQADGTPFLDQALTRYGYLANPADTNGLPVGFSLAPSALGPVVGMTCAACHTRDLTVGAVTYRVDGGPSFGDFGRLVRDLDEAVLRALGSDVDFKAFASRVLGAQATDGGAATKLHDEVALWSLRLHTLVTRSFPKQGWGPARLDAMGLIYDFLVGTDIGPPPSYLIPDNITMADAPARYPFLWNEFHQDYNQWGGFQKNGSDILALARNLGEVIGVFATFHPRQLPPGAPLNVDYASGNSGNFAGLQAGEGLVKLMGPPVWPWPIDKALAAKGQAVFDRPNDQGGCAGCHAIAPGEARGGSTTTWRTPVLDVGTDSRAWPILLRTAQTGVLKGANIPGYYGPLKDQDLAINILKVAVVGAVEEYQAQTAPPPQSPPGNAPPPAPPKPNPSVPANSAPIVVNGYESRVLEGVWAAAPFLHNGSVPTLADLLKPPAERTKRFAVGTAYDPATVGLATNQPASGGTVITTGCADRASGNSNCGHEYGTTLSAEDKKALLEYLKQL